MFDMRQRQVFGKIGIPRGFAPRVALALVEARHNLLEGRAGGEHGEFVF